MTCEIPAPLPGTEESKRWSERSEERKTYAHMAVNHHARAEDCIEDRVAR